MNTEKKILTKKDHERDQIVVQEFANEAVRHQLRISDYRAEGFGGLFRAQSFGQYGAWIP